MTDKPRVLFACRANAGRSVTGKVLAEHYGFEDPSGGLRSHATDVALVRPPITSTGLELIVVDREPRYVALASRHRLAQRPRVTFDELLDEPWIEIVESDPVWCEFWRVADRRSSPPRFGARGRTLDDVLEAARDGRAVGLVPASIAHSQNWPGLAFVEVADIPESEIAVAWRSASQSASVAEFVALAEELGNSRSALSTTA